MLQSTSTLAADTGLPLVFSADIGGGFSNYGLASIAGRKENATSGNAAGYLQFATGNSAGSISERMRINSNGDVGIGGSPSSFSTQKSLSLFAGSSTVARLDFYNSDGSTREAEIITYSSVGESLRIAGITNRPIAFHTNNTKRMVLDEDGSLIVGSSAGLTLTGGVESQNSGLVGTSTTVDLQSGVPGFMSRLSGNNNANQIIGYWFNHGGLNAGIASTRQVTTQWGTDLRFYTHKSQVADQHEVYERLRIYPDGGMRHGAMISNTTHGAGEYFSSGGFISIQNYTFNTSAHCFQVKTGIPTTATRMVIRNDGDLENVNNSYGAYSDASMKENIVDANSQWDDIKALRVRNYNFKEETGQSTHRQIGVIAQEIEAISPGLVSNGFVADDDGNPTDETYKTVTYSVLYMKAVKALQEAIDRIETLESKVSTLEAQ
jgi:chaperonin cofactor prefoldin